MSSGSEAILYDIYGDPMAVEADTAIPSGTAMLINGGSDGTNARYIKVDTSGNQVMVGLGTAGSPSGGVITIQGVVGGTSIPISAASDIVASGTITAISQTVTTADLNGIGTAAIQITGTWSATLQFEGSVDGTNFVNINVRGTNTNTLSVSTTANGLFRVGIAGLRNIRVRSSAFTSGTATITIRQTSEASAVYLHESIPTGNAVIGAVTGSGTFTVNASATVGIVDNAAFTDGTTRIQPVGFIFDEVAGTALTENDGAAARIDSKRAQVITIEDATTRGQRLTITASNAMKVDGSDVTQPISAASLPLPTGAATEATLTTLLLDSTFTTRINTLGQKTSANSTPVVIASDQSAITVTGTVTASNPSVGSNNSGAPTSSIQIGGSDGTNLQATRVFDLDTGGGQEWILGVGLRKSSGGGSVEFGTSSDPIRIDPTGTTVQPVSGTGTFIISGTVAATQSGTWTVQPGNTANTTPWLITINQGGNSATVTGANALKVDGSAVTQPVSGTVTANAGTGNFTVVQSTASNLRAQTSSESNTGAAIPTQASMVGGSDGTNLRALFVDSSGRQIVVGAAASGAAVAGNPVLVGGSDGTNARTLRTATDGTLRIDPTGTTIQPVSDAGGSLTVDTTQLPGALVGGRLDVNNGAWLGSTAPTVGQKTMANSIPVVVSSDQSTLPTKETRSSTATTSSVTGSTSSVTILAANSNRLGATIQNETNKPLYVRLGSPASVTNYTVYMVKDSYYEVPYNYTGIITAISPSGVSGSARVTELT